MQSIHEELSTEFVISVGDHFYDDGVLSDKDPRWKSGFEDIYHPSLAPWYVVFGNHDVRGSIKAQIEYSKRSSVNGHPRWIAPSSYYSQDFQLPNSNGLEPVVSLSNIHSIMTIMILNPLCFMIQSVSSHLPRYQQLDVLSRTIWAARYIGKARMR